ncbi:fatty-acid amide hydrolase 2-A-like [Onthophagus taurus]|uniref:fatty-acid amide hydrolase 2-A-like n=1 Tax=Onthophagus taurus TaxID=166361 RepID=UPI0039BE4805
MDLGLRIGLIVIYFIQWIVKVIYTIFFDNEKRTKLPPFEDKLLEISATELAEKIRKQEICSEEIVKAYIKRIKEVNPIINAVVEERFSAAVAEAKEIDNFLEKSQFRLEEIAKERPLLGIPITIKECIAVKGMSFTGLSLTRKGIKAEEDADAVKLLKKAGAVILLVSNTPEYCMSMESANKIIGKTRNPYNSRCTAGGSSGGEGALLGAGASLIGLGSDIAGSIRFPSAYNGVFGHKPTTRIVSIKGGFPFSSDKSFSDYLVLGPMARYVQDLALVYRVLAADNIKKLNLDKKVDLSTLKVFYMVDSYSNFGYPKMDKNIQSAIKEAAQFLTKSCRSELDETKFDIFGHAMELSGALIFTLDDNPSALKDSEVKYSLPIELAKFFLGKTIFSGQLLFFTMLARMRFGITDQKKDMFMKIAEEDKKILTKALGDNGVLIMPSCGNPAFEHTGFIKAMVDARFNGIINVLGFPSTCVPARLNKDGLPIGIQVVAAPHNDHLTLAVAAELSTYFGGWQPPN